MDAAQAPLRPYGRAGGGEDPLGPEGRHQGKGHPDQDRRNLSQHEADGEEGLTAQARGPTAAEDRGPQKTRRRGAFEVAR